MQNRYRIQAGELSKQVALQNSTYTVTSTGNRVPTWATFATVWAHLEPLSGRELERGKSFGATVSHKVRIRWRGDVTTDSRVLYMGRQFLVNSALNPDEENERLELFCTEIVG